MKGVASVMEGGKKSIVLPASLTALLIVGALSALPGCGKDQAKQAFVDGVISVIEKNQSQPEIAEKGKEAFMGYYQSAFTDLESAAKAAESFTLSNEKDAESLKDLQALGKPDSEAEEIADKLRSGIETMDKGNSIYATELEKAPGQSEEERSKVFEATVEAMNLYLEGITAVISSCEMLRDYAEKNGLEGTKDIEKWIEKFTEEKKSIEQSL